MTEHAPSSKIGPDSDQKQEYAPQEGKDVNFSAVVADEQVSRNRTQSLQRTIGNQATEQASRNRILSLQRTIGNQATLRLLNFGRTRRIQREFDYAKDGEKDGWTGDVDGFRNQQVKNEWEDLKGLYTVIASTAVKYNAIPLEDDQTMKDESSITQTMNKLNSFTVVYNERDKFKGTLQKIANNFKNALESKWGRFLKKSEESVNLLSQNANEDEKRLCEELLKRTGESSSVSENLSDVLNTLRQDIENAEKSQNARLQEAVEGLKTLALGLVKDKALTVEEKKLAEDAWNVADEAQEKAKKSSYSGHSGLKELLEEWQKILEEVKAAKQERIRQEIVEIKTSAIELSKLGKDRDEGGHNMLQGLLNSITEVELETTLDSDVLESLRNRLEEAVGSEINNLNDLVSTVYNLPHTNGKEYADRIKSLRKISKEIKQISPPYLQQKGLIDRLNQLKNDIDNCKPKLSVKEKKKLEIQEREAKKKSTEKTKRENNTKKNREKQQLQESKWQPAEESWQDMIKNLTVPTIVGWRSGQNEFDNLITGAYTVARQQGVEKIDSNITKTRTRWEIILAVRTAEYVDHLRSEKAQEILEEAQSQDSSPDDVQNKLQAALHNQKQISAERWRKYLGFDISNGEFSMLDAGSFGQYKIHITISPSSLINGPINLGNWTIAQVDHLVQYSLCVPRYLRIHATLEIGDNVNNYPHVYWKENNGTFPTNRNPTPEQEQAMTNALTQYVSNNITPKVRAAIERNGNTGQL